MVRAMNTIQFGDCRDLMRQWAAEGVKAQMCVTSPPYFGLRDYGHDGQIGLEQTPEEYISAMVEVLDRKSTRLNSSHSQQSRMPSSA